MDSIVLSFSADGLPIVNQDVVRLANQLSNLQRTLDNVNKGFTSISRKSSAASAITQTGNAAQAATNKLAKFNQQLVLATTGSNLPAIPGSGGTTPPRARQYRPNVAGIAKQPPSFATRAQRALYSTRINMGGASPLLGQLANLAGINGTAGAAAFLPIAAAGLAINAGQNISKTSGLNLLSPGGTGRISRIGAGLGFDPMGTSNSFQNAIQSGAGRSFAMRAGVNPFYNEYSGQGGDFGEKLVKFLKFYGDPTKVGRQRAGAAARAVGLENEIGLSRDASTPVREMLYRNAMSYSQGERRNSADATILSGVAVSEFQKLLNRMAVTILPEVNRELKNALWLWDATTGAIGMVEKKIQGFLKNLGLNVGANSPADKMDKAADKMIRAAEAFNDGAYGSGAGRSRGVINPGVRGAVKSGDAAAADFYRKQGLPI
jgi:hypothetical protein